MPDVIIGLENIVIQDGEAFPLLHSISITGPLIEVPYASINSIGYISLCLKLMFRHNSQILSGTLNDVIRCLMNRYLVDISLDKQNMKK